MQLFSLKVSASKPHDSQITWAGYVVSPSKFLTIPLNSKIGEPILPPGGGVTRLRIVPRAFIPLNLTPNALLSFKEVCDFWGEDMKVVESVLLAILSHRIQAVMGNEMSSLRREDGEPRNAHYKRLFDVFRQLGGS